MEVVVRGGSPEENGHLKKLTEDTFKELALGKKLERIILVSDIGIPAIYLGCRFKRDVQPVVLSDIARIREQGGETRLQITEERYYDEVLSVLAKRYGVESVVQDERNIIFEKGIFPDLEKTVVYDFTEEVREHIIDALWHILPEGFKVRRFVHFEDGFVGTVSDVPTIREFDIQMQAIADEMGAGWHV